MTDTPALPPFAAIVVAAGKGLRAATHDPLGVDTTRLRMGTA